VAEALRKEAVTDQTELVQNQVERIIALVREEYEPDSPTHDLSHLDRVASLSARICSDEGGNQLIVRSAAWLHDLHREAQPEGGRFFVSPEDMDGRAVSILARAGIPENIYPDILEAIHYTDRFTFSDRSLYDTTIEARAVRDADCLDAMGAIGVARAFAFGGAHDIPLWRDTPLRQDAAYIQSDRPSSTMEHFHDKLLRLVGELQTDTAIKLGTDRHAYLRGFVSQFMEELNEDVDPMSFSGLGI
jgi:uncharacterized protein